MNTAVFETDSWMGCQQFICTGETASDVLDHFQKEQDLWCLLRMGWVNESGAYRNQLDILEALLDKYDSGELTMQDLAEFHIHLSIGSIRVLEVSEDIDQVKSRYPRARIL